MSRAPNLFSQKKGQQILNRQLTETIMAAIFILLIIALIVAFWNILVPSADKASRQSFDTLATLIALKDKSLKSYDSAKYTVYLKDSYQIVMFGIDVNAAECGSRPATIMTMSGPTLDPTKEKYTIPKPSDCIQNRRCMCLYKDDPADTGNVVECKNFDANERFSVGAFELNDEKCKKVSNFNNLIIAMKSAKDANSQTIRTLYVWQSTDAHIAEDKQNSAAVCPSTPNKPRPCDGQSDGSPAPSTVAWPCGSETIGDARCTLSADQKSCEIKCAHTIKCSDIKTCNDYNTLAGEGGPPGFYLTAESLGYNPCKNDATSCNVNQGKSCVLNPQPGQVCKPSATNECLQALQDNMDTCKVEYTTATDKYTRIITAIGPDTSS